MTPEEKTLILGALMHDIGKFVQRCTDKLQSHPVKGLQLVEEFDNEFIRIVNTENYFKLMKEIISSHHNPVNDFAKYCKIADHISASERVEKEENEEGGTDWNNNFLASLFSKIRLNSEKEPKLRYFRHQQLTKQNYNALIPEYEQDDANALRYKYSENDLSEFKTQLKIILNFYQDDTDFNTLINLLLILFEKWLWCVPDFTGSSKTDISLFNHLKDVAGLSHAIWKTQKDGNISDKTLNLVIGDIPGIQDYIFDVIYKKPAKILRGRSIFIQVLARNFASKFLEQFELTECNLIMLAGGKFYIVAPNDNSFKDKYNNAVNDIEKYLAENFRYELGFIAGYYNFSWEDLRDRKITFGEIIDRATENLNANKSKQFHQYFFSIDGAFSPQSVILEETYIEPKDGDSNNIKCKVTDKPIRLGRDREISDDEEKILVDQQVKLEYAIGDEVTESNVFLVFNKNDNLNIENVYTLKTIPINLTTNKILINPVLDDLLKTDNTGKGFLRNTLFIEVANYCSKYFDTNGEKISVMPFEMMAEQNEGAQYLTLIKGDVDNLGMIMAYGLTRDKEQITDKEDEKDLTAISRTTTLSNHLKYFFSFFLNGFLRDWEENKQKELEEIEKRNKSEITKAELQKIKNENRVYTVFAGGDDLMIICPQSSSLNLLKNFNDVFTEFVVSNPEVHISYSLTNFKHHTPIRIVADIAEDNQKESKRIFKSKLKPEVFLQDSECFYAENDKAGTLLFDTPVKNSRHNDIITEREKLIQWVKDNENPVTMGTIRNLLQLSEIIRAYEKNRDTSKLIWHPMLTYYLNRNIRGKKGTTKEVEEFFDKILSIYKDESARKIQSILYPVLCETIYKLRK